ncbi:MAG TPA: hypothetical protein VNB49_16010 [Candidatus Dormibacteraeota bacterium]|nr:hypothetical protein [Candidatus Dormibacteraeota bacterium]
MPTKKSVQRLVILTMMPSAILCLHAQSSQSVLGIALDRLELHNVKAEVVNYNGKRAVRVDALPDAANDSSYAILKGSRFHNGTIDVELAGKPSANAGPGARGFIGIAFRVQGNRFEYIYLRPTNGRADDQIRRNHSTQYAAYPEFDFDRLRKESPEKYESYVDLEPGAWTNYRIVIDGTKVRLFVQGATQPCVDRKRYEAWRFRGRGGTVRRARHGRLLRQS